MNKYLYEMEDTYHNGWMFEKCNMSEEGYKLSNTLKEGIMMLVRHGSYM